MIDYSTLDNIEVGDGYIVGNRGSNTNVKGLDYLAHEELCGHFDGVNTFMEWLEANRNNGRRKYGSDSQSKGKSGFHKFESYEEAINVFKNDPASLIKFDEAEDGLHSGDSAGNTVDYDIVGDFIDMGRFVEGVPETFGFLKDGNPRSKRMRIAVYGMFSAGVNQQKINERAVRIQRLTDWLESNGIRCEITAFWSNDNWHCEVVVKKFDEIFNINDIAVASDSEFFRRAQFQFAEFSPTLNSWNYGNPRDFWIAYDRHKKQFASEYNAEYSMVVGGETYNIGGAFDVAEKMIKTRIEEDNAEEVVGILEGFS